MRKFLQILTFGVAFALSLLGFAAHAADADLTVTTGEDGLSLTNGLVTLRDVVTKLAANASLTRADGTRTVTFNVAEGHVALTNVVVIPTGTASFTIDGFNAGRGIILTTDPTNTTGVLRHNGKGLALQNVTFADAIASNAAITASGPLSVSNAVFRANTRLGASPGAALAVTNAALTVQNCTFLDNVSASGGGAVALDAGTDAFFLNCSFRGNIAAGDGGALLAQQGATGALAYCTFDGNRAQRGGSVMAAAGSIVKAAGVACADGAASESGTCFASESGAVLTVLGSVVDEEAVGSGVYSNVMTRIVSAPEKVLVGSVITQMIGTVEHVIRAAHWDASFLSGPILACSHDLQKVVARSADYDVSGMKNHDLSLRGNTAFPEEEEEFDQFFFVDHDLLGDESICMSGTAIGGTYLIEILFDTQGGTCSSTQVWLKVGRAVASIPVPTRTGFTFAGWYTEPNFGGERIFTADGRPLLSEWDYENTEDFTLYAAWVDRATALTVTTTKDGLRPDGQISLRDALGYLQGDPTLTAPDGTRTISFDLADGELQLESPLTLELSSASETFAIDGANGGRGLLIRPSSTITSSAVVASGPARIQLSNLTFAGSDGGVQATSALTVASGAAGVTVSNCSFRAWNGTSAAVTLIGGVSSFRDCMFDENQTLDLSVGSLAASATVINATFLNVEGQDPINFALGQLSLDHCTVLTGTSSALPSRVTVTDSLVSYRQDASLTNLFAFGAAMTETKIQGVTHRTLTPFATTEVRTATPLAMDQLGAPEFASARGAQRGRMACELKVEVAQGTYSGFTSTQVVCGAEMPIPPAPHRAGYQFGGWRNRAATVPAQSPVILTPIWTSREGDLIVIAEEDGEELPSGELTLRDAFKILSEESVTGTRKIRFNVVSGRVRLKSPITIPANAGSFILDGANEGRGLVIESEEGELTNFLQADEGTFSATFQNLMFVGSGSDTRGGALDLPQGSQAVISNCLFRSNRNASGSAVRIRGTAQILSSSFTENVSSAVPDVTVEDGAQCGITNCTFSSSSSGEDAYRFVQAKGTGSLTLDHCTFGAASGTGPDFGGESCSATSLLQAGTNQLADVFYGGTSVTVRVAGVEQVVYIPRADWSAVQFGTAPVLMTDGLGAAEQATGCGAVRSRWATRLQFDVQGGRALEDAVMLCGETIDTATLPTPVRNGWEFLGWTAPSVVPYATQVTVVANWKATSKLLTVGSAADEPNQLDGTITLREAIEGLLSDPSIAAETGRVITLAENLGTISLKGGIDIPAGTPELTIEGHGATLSYYSRIFDCGEGTSLVLNDLTFAGRLESAGRVQATNCAFREIRGGAVFLSATNDVLQIFRDCSFCDNSNYYYPVVNVSSPARFISCTFCGNSTSGATLCLEQGGVIASCTFAQNETSIAVDVTGGVCQSVNTIYADNTGKNFGAQPPVSTADTIGLTCADLFVGGTRQSSPVRGVRHDYYTPLGIDIEGIRDARAIWHSADWAHLAISGSFESSGKTALVGDVFQATELLVTDQLASPISFPNRGSIGASEASAEVTILDDVNDPDDGLVSLREALAAIAKGSVHMGTDGRYEVTFASSLFTNGLALVRINSAKGDITIPEGRAVTIAGPTDGSRLTLACETGCLSVPAAADVEIRALAFKTAGGSAVASTGRLVLTDCTFEGMAGPARGLVAQTGGSLIAERCSWQGCTGGPCVKVTNATATLVTCSVFDCVLSTDAAITFGAGADGLVVFSTLTGNIAPYGAVAQPANDAKSVCVCNSIAIGNHQSTTGKSLDIYSKGAIRLVTSAYTTFSAPGVMGDLLQVDACLEGLTAYGSTSSAAVFTGAAAGSYVNGTRHWSRALASGSSVVSMGSWLMHDADWNSVVSLVDRYGTSRRQLRGTLTSPSLSVTADIFSRTLDRDMLAPGSCASPTDMDAFADGVILVNSLSDGETGKYDGLVTLRDALVYANAHEEVRDAGGNCTIRFRDALFTDNRAEILWTDMQARVDGFSGGGTLTVAGPGGIQALTLNAQNRYRFFDVAAGNRLRLENINFINALGLPHGQVGTTAGGAIYSAGETSVSNCSFTACSTVLSGFSEGGAICTASGGVTRVERCSFSGCKAGKGGALATRAFGSTYVLATTFANNVAETGATIDGGSGGAVAALDPTAKMELVNCTLAGNAADKQGGGLVEVGTDPLGSKVTLCNTLVCGNRAGLDGHDLWVDQPITCIAVLTNETSVFAHTLASGTPIATNAVVGGVTHVIVPCRDGAALPTADASAANLADQLGETAAAAFVGAVRRTAEAQVEPDPVEPTPLVISGDGDPCANMTAAIAAGLADPENLIVRGELILTFAEGVTDLALTKALTIAKDTFKTVTLVVRGPVTFRSDGTSHRFFEIEANNHVRFENVTFTGATAESFPDDELPTGGALWANESYLVFTNCTFASNTATGSYGGYGGAVGLTGASGSAKFSACTFTGNVAEAYDGIAIGASIYREHYQLALENCTFDGDLAEQIGDWGPRAAVEKADGTVNYYDLVQSALLTCREGDTLVILSSEAEEMEALATSSLPYKVKIRNASGGTAGVYERLLLNTLAEPDPGLTLEIQSDSVIVRPSVIMPDLFYALESHDALEGFSASEETVQELEWVKANAAGSSPQELRAPKRGTSGFYRVRIKLP